MSFEKNLLQMKKLIKKKPVQETTLASFVMPQEPTYTKEWKNAGFSIVENKYGIVFEKKTVYSPHTKHGSFILSDVFEAFKLWNETKEQHPIATNGEGVVFFDTETTGLKGTGTYIFLTGQLKYSNGQFELTQLVMANPSHETAFLYASELWKPDQTYITYNGKSFDWPQLQTRWVLNRSHLPKLPEPKHIDLLHGSRRVWKDDLVHFKLTHLEEEKLGFKRVGDIPGHLAPIIYLDAIKSGNPTTLLKVLHHNEWDILSLLTLFVHSSRLLLQDSYQETANTSTNIGKWFSDLKIYNKSQEHFEQITAQYNLKDAARAFFYVGFDYKRMKQTEDAYRSFEQSLAHLPDQLKIRAYEELAKMDEHHFKKFDHAQGFCDNALELIGKMTFKNNKQKTRVLESFEKRLKRLRNKENISRASAQFDRKRREK